MSNSIKANQNIVYLNHRSSGLPSSISEKTVLSNTMSNITKGQVIVIPSAPTPFKPVSKTK